MSSAAVVGRAEVPAGRSRRSELDLLRALVVVGLVFFHSARVFDSGAFYVKNDPPSELVDAVIAFASVWGMPLLFVIAGVGIWYSLGTRTTGSLARERVGRLLVPLVFGVVVVVPPQIWTRLRGRPLYDESYGDFLARFLDVELTLGDFPFVVQGAPGNDLFETAHLWFLVLLFSFTMLLLPAIWALRRPSGTRLLDRVAGAAQHLGVLVAAAIPLAVIEGLGGSEEGLAGWNRYSYLVLILYGYVLATDPRFGQALHRHRRPALIGAVITFIVVGVFLIVSARGLGELLVASDAVTVGIRATKAFSGWLWVVAILGYATRSRPGHPIPSSTHPPGRRRWARVLGYAAAAVLPVYVLHQTVIVLLAFYLVQWPVHALLKYLALVGLSLALIIVIYDLLVRRTRTTRFLFGMK